MLELERESSDFGITLKEQTTHPIVLLNRVALILVTLGSLFGCMRKMDTEKITLSRSDLPSKKIVLLSDDFEKKLTVFLAGMDKGEIESARLNLRYLKEQGVSFETAWAYIDRPFAREFDATSDGTVVAEILVALSNSGITPDELGKFDDRFWLRDISLLVENSKIEIPKETLVTEANAFDQRFDANQIRELLELKKTFRYANNFDARFSGCEIVEMGKRDVFSYYANHLNPIFDGKATGILFDDGVSLEFANGPLATFIEQFPLDERALIVEALCKYDYENIPLESLWDSLKHYNPAFLVVGVGGEWPALFLHMNNIVPDEANFYYEELAQCCLEMADDIAKLAVLQIQIDQIKPYYEPVGEVAAYPWLNPWELADLIALGISSDELKTQVAVYQNCPNALAPSGILKHEILNMLILKCVPPTYALPRLDKGVSCQEILKEYIGSKFSKNDLDNLKANFNIDDIFLHRYDVQTLQTLLKNLDPHYEKGFPVALIILPKSDWNGALENVFVELVTLTEAGYKVFLYEAGNENEVLNACEKFATLHGVNSEGEPLRPIHHLMLNGHGDLTSLSLGEPTETGYLDTSDTALYSRISRFMTDRSLILLNSCSTGPELGRILFQTIGKATTVFGPKGPTSVSRRHPSAPRRVIYAEGKTIKHGPGD